MRGVLRRFVYQGLINGASADIAEVDLSLIITRDVEPVVGSCRSPKVAAENVPRVLRVDVLESLELHGKSLFVLSGVCNVNQQELVCRVKLFATKTMLAEIARLDDWGFVGSSHTLEIVKVIFDDSAGDIIYLHIKDVAAEAMAQHREELATGCVAFLSIN